MAKGGEMNDNKVIEFDKPTQGNAIEANLRRFNELFLEAESNGEQNPARWAAMRLTEEQAAMKARKS